MTGPWTEPIEIPRRGTPTNMEDDEAAVLDAAMDDHAALCESGPIQPISPYDRCSFRPVHIEHAKVRP